MAFIKEYVLSPFVETLYKTDYMDSDQLRFEQTIRTMIAERDLEYPGKPDFKDWEYYYRHGAIYVDRSTFYYEMTYCRFDAVTTLVSDSKRDVDATLWTYGAATIWVNGKKVHANDVPCYKPIMMHKFTLPLEKGENEIYVTFQTFGTRDTRTLFGIEVSDMTGIDNVAPALKEGSAVAKWLDGVKLEKNHISFPSCDFNYEVGYNRGIFDFASKEPRFTWTEYTGEKEIDVPEEYAYITVRVKVGAGYLSRKLEVAEHVHPEYREYEEPEKNLRTSTEFLASVEGFGHGDEKKVGHFINNVLARKALGIVNPKDDVDYIHVCLDQIEKRFDCSDFLLAGVIRYLKNYKPDPEVKKRIDDVLLNYRYWMNMKGSDAMCFWSENHALLFYSCAMIVGAMYPDSYFPRAERTGKELSAYGRELTRQWFVEFEKHGFEEFLSTTYMNVTLAGLLNIVDYADEELSAKAEKALDLMFYELSLHTFQGSTIAPMGRIYRSVINPAQQGTQCLMNLIDPHNPIKKQEGWFVFLETSRYKLKNEYSKLMKGSVDKVYPTGDALVNLKKSDDYILTSVASPRLDGFQRWENVTLRPDARKFEGTHHYTKSFNERFHGTTFFEPGTFGYQQHMWIAGLSNEAIVFVNLPGDSFDSSTMRPGYWYGNGVMPAVRQTGNVLSAIYQIPETYPVKFTHMFLPECKFDVVEKKDNWIFLRKNNGYLALWMSREGERYDDELSDCELRFYGKDSAFICFAGSENEYGSFDDFKKAVQNREIRYDAENGKIYLDGCLYSEYTESGDKTQYL